MLIVNRSGVDYFQCQGYFGDMVEIPISDIDYFGRSYLDWDHSDVYPRVVTVVYTLPFGTYYLAPVYSDIADFLFDNGYLLSYCGEIIKVGGDK